MNLPDKVKRLQDENPNASMAEVVNMLTDVEREILFDGFSEEELEELLYDADFWLRPKQKIDGDDWYITAAIAGRGFGKTRLMSEWVRKKATENPGCRIFIGGRTVSDVRNTMVLGASGVIEVHPPSEKPEYKQQQAALVWPNGSSALLLSSEVPDAARGPQAHYAALDEFAAWKTTVDSSGATLYTNILAATRLGQNPQIVMATTPKRTAVMKELIERAKDPKQRIRIVRGSTLENASLSKTYIDNLLLQYGDTDLAKQEIEGMMLDDAEGIAFTQEMIDRAKEDPQPPNDLFKIIAIDPSVAADPKTADECGIMVMGVTRESDPRYRKVYLLEDLTIRGTVDQWVNVVVQAAKDYRIDNIVAEKNQGGDLIRAVLQAQNSSLKVHLVWAAKGKVKRVEPVALAMQKFRVKFDGDFPALEDQLLFYDPEDSVYSPDRMDAFAWGVTALIIDVPKTMHFGTLRGHRVHAKVPSRMAGQKRLILPRTRRL